jgi:hypothetical protein
MVCVDKRQVDRKKFFFDGQQRIGEYGSRFLSTKWLSHKRKSVRTILEAFAVWMSSGLSFILEF